MLAFQEFQVDDMSVIYFELYNVHYIIWRFEDEDENQEMEQKLFLMVDHEVVVVDIELTNHTNDDDENDIDHRMLDNEHIQPKYIYIQIFVNVLVRTRFTFVS
jgi:glycine cleavage system protein P-like pyridoxal-binding family